MKRKVFKSTCTASIDYESLFRHVKNLRILTLVGAGRSGTDFFHSLLDSHPQIVQLPGSTTLDWNFVNPSSPDPLRRAADKFIYQQSQISKFKSCLNEMERWDQLGDDRDQSVEVDIDEFRSHLFAILEDKELSNVNFFFAVHLAYAIMTGVNMRDATLLFYHIHNYDLFSSFNRMFSQYDVLFMTRDPRNGLVRYTERFKVVGKPWHANPRGSVYDDPDLSYDPRTFYGSLRYVFAEAEPVLEFTNNLKALTLEKLHLQNEVILREIANTYGFDYQPSMLKSTFWGLQWWGDMKSGKYLKGFNKDIMRKKWPGKLNAIDSFLMEFLLYPRLKAYSYALEYRHNGAWPLLHFVVAPFLILLPMKYEAAFLLFHLRRRSATKFVAVFVFYALRVGYYYSRFVKRIRGDVFVADHF